MTRAPAHAGRLRLSERFVFALVFALMAGFVVAITMSAAGPLHFGLPGSATTVAGAGSTPADEAGSLQLQSAGTGAVQSAERSAASHAAAVRPASARLDALLAAAMGTVLRAHHGAVAVGVIDLTTGQQALYHAETQFRAADIMTADILAALLIRHQRAGTSVTSAQAHLVTAMMENGSVAAAAALWRAIGGGNGAAAANHLLNLSHTSPGSGDQWDLTSTTVADQLALLTDLTTARSPLPSAARNYVLGLLAVGAARERWGVGAAAAGDSGYAVGGGGLPDGRLWDVNSIGVVTHTGHVLLIAVLSSRSPTEAAGRSLASAAAAAAADIATKQGS
ncbi:MAG TPA: hypothetical protein VK823_12915 [Streptosporangiaceae bacterium]|nr:hypothetical protein [Streptosporangiaceae bacterium]